MKNIKQMGSNQHTDRLSDPNENGVYFCICVFLDKIKCSLFYSFHLQVFCAKTAILSDV